MIDKEAQLKAKLLKMKLAATRKYKDTRTREQKLRDDDIAEYRHQQRIDKNKSKLTKSQSNDVKDDIAERTNDSKTASKKEKKVDKKLKKIGDDHNRIFKKEQDARPLIKEVPMGVDKRDNSKINYFSKMKAENDAIDTGKKIRPKKPTDEDFGGIITAKTKINKLKKKTSIPDEIMQEASDAAGQNKNLAPSYIAQDHHHSIVFKGHRLGGFRSASLNSQAGKYAKYWLLNAKETNGNGWGIAAHTASQNMKKFIGRPLVVTAQSWHGASEYGEQYEHPYLPTNDIAAILKHQEKFRVGSIVDVYEDKNGDWFANVEMLPKFANNVLPPFCSPAIYQLDAKENEGQISKWEALHLAALNENPAYGSRIALLKGTCMGTGNECKVQFKVAKLEGNIVCTKKLKGRVANLKKKQKIALDLTDNVKHHMKGFMGRPEKKKTRFEKELFGDMLATNSKSKMQLLTNLESIRDDKILKRDDEGDIIDSLGDTRGTALVHSFSKDNPHGITSPIDKQEQEYQQTKQLMKKPVDGPNTQMTQERATRTLDDIAKGNARKTRPIPTTHSFKLSKLKARLKLATLGEQNMTYQESKKIKIHKKKHPEVRKARKSVEDILRGRGSSVDGSHSQESFLSSRGDFIGGGGGHSRQIDEINGTHTLAENRDSVINDFVSKHSLPRVQTFRINRAGDRQTSFHINSKINSTQLKSIMDTEKGGRKIGFAVGNSKNIMSGSGTKDMMKALREHKFL